MILINNTIKDLTNVFCITFVSHKIFEGEVYNE